MVEPICLSIVGVVSLRYEHEQRTKVNVADQCSHALEYVAEVDVETSATHYDITALEAGPSR